MKPSFTYYFVALVLMVGSFSATGAARNTQQSSAEVVVAGVVKDSGTQKAIAYASVGVMSETTGTISNEDGAFSLTVPAHQQNKIIRISAIGYEAKEIKVADLVATVNQTKATVALTAKTVQLAEVNVKARQWKTKKLGGNVGPFTMFYNTFTVNPKPISENLGREHGVLIHNQDKLSFLSKLNFCINANHFEKVKFRVNVYSMKDGMPDQNLVTDDIIVTLGKKEKGWKQVDLEPYNLYVEQDFVITLEWIDGEPKTGFKPLSLSASLPGFQTTFHKGASQAKWDKMSAAGIGMNVVVQREK